MSRKQRKRRLSSAAARCTAVPPEVEYQPDEEPKRKHHWDRDEPGFEEQVTGERVAKCPSSLSLDDAQRLLRGGVGFSPAGWKEPWPQRVHAVFRGVVYRATPTVPGKSYHGFPELPQRFPPSRQLRDRVLRQAEAEGPALFDRVKKWLR